MPTPAPKRKRSRATLEQEPEEEEVSTNQIHTLLSTTERSKFNTSGCTPTTGTRLSCAGRIEKGTGGSIGGLVSWNGEKRKEKVTEDANEPGDEGERNGKTKSIWDTENSEPEQKSTRGSTWGKKKNSENHKPSSTPNCKGKVSARLGSHNETADALGEEVDIYDFPAKGEDEALVRRRIRPGATSADHVKFNSASPAKIKSAKKTWCSPGRPRKSEGLMQAKQLSRKPTLDRVEIGEATNGEAEDALTQSSRKRGRPRKEDSRVEATSIPEVATSGRKRGRPMKGLDAKTESTKNKKGVIFTPSKKDVTSKSRKSVAFEEQDVEMDLGFKDLPKISIIKKVKKGKAPVDPAQIEKSKDLEVDRAVSKDTACRVCSGLKSNKHNEIILCEGCDFAVHLKCYELTSIPEGDWLCRGCGLKGVVNGPSFEGEQVPDEGLVEIQEDIVKSNGDEGIACTICSGLDSKRGNQIILCDTCDFAVHVKCYELPSLPKGNWFCKDCLPGVEQDDFGDDEVAEDVSNKLPHIEGIEDHLHRMKRALLDKLTGKKRIKIYGHGEEMQKVHQVVEQTIIAGEGNSMLVIGARGCGKTALVESVISNLSTHHRDNFHIVRLNGFIHTDDKLALKEIWRQLGREMGVEDDLAAKTSNYADTLASLLALLSHPSEISDSQQEQTAKSVVFILDEFDIFTTHPRQTLLYNLFDIAQARKAPIVVLGLTTRVDVIESLEKRVKSRFSHRYVHLALPRSISAFWEICREGLTVDPEDLGADDFDIYVDVTGRDDFLSFWQRMIEDLYSKDTVFKHHIQSHFYRSKSVPEFFTSCILPIVNISTTNLPLTGKKFALNSMSLSAPDSKLRILQGLSELELALLISAARLDIILDTDTCNFAMVYDEYSSLTSKHKIQMSSTGVTALGSSAKVWGRDVVLGSWERLAKYELLVPAGIGGSGSREAGAAGRMWKVDVGLEEITGSIEGLNGVMDKWCREL